MIPRFSYSFSIRKVWRALTELRAEPQSNEGHYKRLFPHSTVYELDSARQGLTICLQALQLRKNALVGIQPYTCSSVLVAIEAAGCRPVFLDLNNRLTLNVSDLAQKVRMLDVLIVTHTFGIAAEIAAIRKIADKLPIIEDCAHAFWCKQSGHYLGSQFDLAVFSFGNGKFPALGSGGLIVVNNATYNQVISRSVNQLKENSLASEIKCIIRQFLYALIFSRIGYQIQYTFIEPYIKNRGKEVVKRKPSEYGMSKVVRQRINREWDEVAVASARQRQQAVATMNVPAQLQWLYNPDSESNCFSLVCLASERDALYNFLMKRGIGAGKHFQHAKSWAMEFGYVEGSCPTFERLLPHILTLPCHNTLTIRETAHMQQALADYGQIKTATTPKVDQV